MSEKGNAGRVLIVGNFLSSAGRARSVCEDLAERLSAAGWLVRTTSSRTGRLRRLLEMLRTVWHERSRYDVAQVDVYSGNAFVWAELVCATLRLLGKRYVVSLHGGNLPRFYRRWPERVRRLLRSATFVTCPSDFLAEQLRSVRADIVVLPNGLDVERHEFSPRRHLRPLLVWVRAFHRIYNPSLAPRVVARLAPDFDAVRLTMIGPDKGDGTFRETREAAEWEGVSRRVLLPGAIPKHQISDWLESHDVFLNTTNVDNAPVSLLEAMACGLCVVSTRVGGVPDLVCDEEDALLVPPDDVDAMAAAVRRLLTDPDLAEKLSRNGRTRAESHDWSILLPRWTELLLSAASSCSKRTHENREPKRSEAVETSAGPPN